MAATTDNSIDLALRVPRGAYVVNKQATDMFPFLKDLASKYPVPKKDLAVMFGSEEEVMKEVKNIKSVNEQIQNSIIIKKIFVPNKILNIVISKNE